MAVFQIILFVVLASAYALNPWDPTATSLSGPSQPQIGSNGGMVLVSGQDLVFDLNNGSNIVNASVQELVDVLARHASTLDSNAIAITATNASLFGLIESSSSAAAGSLNAAVQTLQSSVVSAATAASMQVSSTDSRAASNLSTATAALWGSLSTAASARTVAEASLAASVSATAVATQSQVVQVASSVAQASTAIVQAGMSIGVANTNIANINTILGQHSSGIVSNSANTSLLSSALVAVQTQLTAQINQVNSNGVSTSGAVVLLSSSLAASQLQLQSQINLVAQGAQTNLTVLATQTTNSLTILGNNITALNAAVSTLNQAMSTRVAVDASIAASLSAQISTVYYTLSVAVSASSLLTTFKTGLFTWASAAGYPNAQGMPSGNILWLDAMNLLSANQQELIYWNDIAPYPSASRQWSWSSIDGGLPVLVDGAFQFFGNGFFTTTTCNTNLVFGSGDRTLLFWARPRAANIYIKHVFHYGNTVNSQAFGATMVMGDYTNYTTAGLGVHQWGYQASQAGNWLFGEAAFFAIILQSGTYTWSKNGGNAASFPGTALPLPNTVYNSAAGYCNVGARISGAENFAGAISAIFMYSRALSNAEINYIYTATNRVF